MYARTYTYTLTHRALMPPCSMQHRRTRTHIHTQAHTYTHTSTHIHTHTSTHIHMYARTYTLTHTGLRCRLAACLQRRVCAPKPFGGPPFLPTPHNVKRQSGAVPVAAALLPRHQQYLKGGWLICPQGHSEDAGDGKTSRHLTRRSGTIRAVVPVAAALLSWRGKNHKSGWR